MPLSRQRNWTPSSAFDDGTHNPGSDGAWAGRCTLWLGFRVRGFAADGVAFGYDEESGSEPVVLGVRLELPG